jgi:hypothetical protein
MSGTISLLPKCIGMVWTGINKVLLLLLGAAAALVVVVFVVHIP